MGPVEIANIALVEHLGANGISDFEDDSSETETVSAAYDAARDEVLEAKDWPFASEWVEAQKLAAAPVSPRHAAAYAKPTRAAAVREATDASGGEVAWKPEGGNVLTEGAYDSILLRITSKETDPALYSPGFVSAFALLLAARMCVTLTENEERARALEALYRDALRTGGARAGKQGTAERRTSSWLRDARR